MNEVEISRYELGQLSQLQDSAQWGNEQAKKGLTELLDRIGLPANASRFDIAMRKEEIEYHGGRTN